MVDGWYDYAEMSMGGDIWVFDAFTQTWKEKEDDPDEGEHEEEQEM